MCLDFPLDSDVFPNTIKYLIGLINTKFSDVEGSGDRNAGMRMCEYLIMIMWGRLNLYLNF